MSTIAMVRPDQSKELRKNSIQVSHGGGKDPKYFSHHLLLSGVCSGRKLNGKWSRDLNTETPIWDTVVPNACPFCCYGYFFGHKIGVMCIYSLRERNIKRDDVLDVKAEQVMF